MGTMRIVLADDHKIMRAGLRALIEQLGMEVVGEAGDGYEMLSLVSSEAPDIVVADVGMPGLNGLEATRRLSADGSRARVVALSAHTDRRYVTGMFEAGAFAYLPKSAAFDELGAAIAAAARGQRYLSPQIAGVFMAGQLWGNDAGRAARLSAREREVLHLLANGLSSKEIATQLAVALTTVETHRRNISTKLGIHSVAALTKYAIREGLTSVGE